MKSERSLADLLSEGQRMERFRKEANLPAAALNAAELAAKAVGGMGKGIWRGAKWLGGGTNLGGAGILAGTGLAATQVPEMVRKARQDQDEIMAPWQGQRMRPWAV